MNTPQPSIPRPVPELFGQYPGYGFAGFGVSTATGNYTHTAIDLGFPGGLLGLLDLTRTYNSLSDTAGSLGTGWAHSLSVSLTPPAAGATPPSVTFLDAHGRVLTFVPDPAGGYRRPQDLDADLTHNADGSYTLVYNSGLTLSFDAAGRLTSRAWEGQQVSYDYDTSGRPVRAGHASGPALSLAYDSAGRLSRAEASDGRAVAYSYAADGTLTSVTDPAGGITRYETTADGRFQATDPDGSVVVANTYDHETGRVTHQDLPTGGTADFSYDTGAGTTTVTSQSGAELTFQADTAGRMVKVTDPNGNAAGFGYDGHGYLSSATSPGDSQLAQEHDSRGNLLSSTFGGAVTRYEYDTSDRPTAVHDPTGGTVGYRYSADTQVPSQVTDQNGAPTHFESSGGRITKHTDPDGNVTSYDYDAAGNLVSVTDPAGDVTRYTYDGAGHRTAQISATNATTSYAYDPAGRVTAVTDPLGNITRYRYSPAGRVLEITDPTGAVTAHAYNAAGQLISVTDSLGRVTTYDYDHDGNLTTTTAPGGAVTSTEYDHAGRVTAITDPLGHITRHEYDADGNLTAVTDPLGHTTHRRYDARGNLTEVTDPAGGITRYAYDAADRQITVTDPAGGVWHTGYDPAGRVITTTDPTGAVTRQLWTPNGNLASATDPLGRETRYGYSPTQLLISIADPQGGVAQYDYDADGRRIWASTPAMLKTQYRYDAASRLVATVDQRGWITRYEYNSRGQQVAQISPSGAVTRDRYDPAGQRIESTDPNGSATRFGYDAGGHLTQVTDAKGGISRYGYDRAGQQTSFTDPLGRVTTQEYDAAGNLITITDPAGNAQHLAYDSARRLIQRSASDTEVSYTYDAAGRRASMTDATGTTRYSYDSTGRLLTVTEPDGGVTAASYDAAGQRTSLKYPGDLELTYRYDLNGRLIALHDSRAGWAAYALDPDGRLLTEQLPGRLARRYRYDHGLLSRFTVNHDGHPVARAAFAHDPDGRIATVRDGTRLSHYRYDPAGQLTGIFSERRIGRPDYGRDPGAERRPAERLDVRLTYDVLGNRTRLRRGDAETHYAYDPASQLLATEGHGRRTEYRYDPAGRLTEEREADGRDDDAGPRPGEEHREARRHRAISYNGFGQPVSVTRTWPGRTERIQSVFNGNALLASITLASEDTRTEEQRAALARYRWDSSQVPQILAQHAEPSLDDAERDRPGRLDADFAYGYGRTFASWERGAAVFHADAFGSAVRTEATEPWAQASRYGTFGTPVGLLDREPAEQRGHRHEYPDGPGEPDHEDHPRPERPHWPDDDGPERPHRPDDDWPEPAERPHPETPELPRFGYRGELALGPMIYLRARAYDSELGRFTTPDPLAAQPRVAAAVSPYVYASNDPLNITDPSGLFSFGSLVSSVVHVVKHVVSGAQHAVHAVTGAITRGAEVVAGRVAHAFEAVHSVLDQVAATAAKDAARVVHVVRDAATHVVHAVSDAVSRSVGIVKSTVTQATTWIKKHNQIIGKIGAFLSNVSGDLALAGLVIAPIPGLDALTPVLEGAALATSLGALATQGVARAAGDQNITVGDLIGDSLGAIPGGGDAEDLERGIQTASHATEDATDATPRFFRGARPGEDPTFAPRPNEYKVDPATGTVRPTHGVSVFDNPGSVASKGFEPHEVNQSTIPSQLRIIQRGGDLHHYEIVPQLGTSLTPEEFADLLGQISCFPGG